MKQVTRRTSLQLLGGAVAALLTGCGNPFSDDPKERAWLLRWDKILDKLQVDYFEPQPPAGPTKVFTSPFTKYGEPNDSFAPASTTSASPVSSAPSGPASRAGAAAPTVLYAVDPAGALLVIDPDNAVITSTVSVPPGSQFVQGSPDGRTAYVSATGRPRPGPSVTVIDAANYTVGKSISLPSTSFPGRMFPSPDGATLYVLWYEGSGGQANRSGIFVIDPAAGTLLQTLNAPSGSYFTDADITPDGQLIFAVGGPFTATTGTNVFVIDTGSLSVVNSIRILGVNLGTPKAQRLAAMDPTGAKLYLPTFTGLAVLDTASLTPAPSVPISLAGNSAIGIYRIQLNPIGTRIGVAALGNDNLTYFLLADPVTHRVTYTSPGLAGSGPFSWSS